MIKFIGLFFLYFYRVNWSENILKEHGLKKTAARLKALEFFKQNNSAVSHNDLEQHIGNETDRVTLYRLLNTFKEKGIIHSIVNQRGGIQYALCGQCSEHNHHDNHLHFTCTNCSKTICLEQQIPTLQLPEGFLVNDVQLHASGLCNSCSR